MIEDLLRRHGTGDLAGGRAAHAVGDHEERAPRADDLLGHGEGRKDLRRIEVRHEEGVLVVVPGAAEIGAAKDADPDVRRHIVPQRVRWKVGRI